MGTYIKYFLEKKDANGEYACVDIADSRNEIHQSYRVYGWLADVRNYSAITPIIPENRGIPKDVCPSIVEAYDNGLDTFSASYLTVEELLAFDYTQYCEDRRCTLHNNGGSTCEPGDGAHMPYSEFLGKWFMDFLKCLEENKVDRIVFWFN